jgi:hypothetical protein
MGQEASLPVDPDGLEEQARLPPSSSNHLAPPPPPSRATTTTTSNRVGHKLMSGRMMNNRQQSQSPPNSSNDHEIVDDTNNTNDVLLAPAGMGANLNVNLQALAEPGTVVPINPFATTTAESPPRNSKSQQQNDASSLSYSPFDHRQDGLASSALQFEAPPGDADSMDLLGSSTKPSSPPAPTINSSHKPASSAPSSSGKRGGLLAGRASARGAALLQGMRNLNLSSKFNTVASSKQQPPPPTAQQQSSQGGKSQPATSPSETDWEKQWDNDDDDDDEEEEQGQDQAQHPSQTLAQHKAAAGPVTPMAAASIHQQYAPQQSPLSPLEEEFVHPQHAQLDTTSYDIKPHVQMFSMLRVLGKGSFGKVSFAAGVLRIDLCAIECFTHFVTRRIPTCNTTTGRSLLCKSEKARKQVTCLP